jgi:crotonobetainyl-CoA:carnitine CoA-transferase CaiB-like acyl-CoA transferase
MAMPLAGVRVIDFSQALAGPFAMRTLGDLGAEVIKVEQPGIGDLSRKLGPHFLSGESAYFMNVNRNKKGITLDLRKPEGREILYKLVAISDVVMDAFRPAVLPRLGLDYESLRKANGSIVSCSISGFGQEGPYKDRPGFDGIIQAMGGGMSVTGKEGWPPVYMGFPIGDLAGGYAAAIGICAALTGRGNNGEGRRVDVSLLDVQIALQAHLGQFYLISGDVPKPIGSSHPSNLPAGAYECNDGKWVQIHCVTQEFHEKLMNLLANNVIGMEYLPKDVRFATQNDRIANRDDLDQVLNTAFRTKPRYEWLDLFVEGDIPGGPVNSIADALADPQIQIRNMVVEVDHPKAGRYRTAGNPIKMGEEEIFNAPPMLGQHTDEILGGLLGYSVQEIQNLKDIKVL